MLLFICYYSCYFSYVIIHMLLFICYYSYVIIHMLLFICYYSYVVIHMLLFICCYSYVWTVIWQCYCYEMHWNNIVIVYIFVGVTYFLMFRIYLLSLQGKFNHVWRKKSNWTNVIFLQFAVNQISFAEDNILPIVF